MNNSLQMDWIDGIAMALGFLFGTGIGFIVPELMEFASNISVITMLGAPVLRRKLIGPPDLGIPKEGVIWRLCSVLGLFIVFFSMVFFWLAGFAFSDMREPMPDFRSEVLKEEAEWNERYHELDALTDAVFVPKGTPQEEIDRLMSEKKAKREKERAANVEGRIANREKEFSQWQDERFQGGIQFFLLGIGICLLGSLLLRLRYPFGKDG